MTPEPDSYRYERKFLISDLSKYELETIVKMHPAIFDEVYYERNINNIYFDTYDMTNYFDNVDGNSQRVKYRIRWYGNLLGSIQNPVLEIKLKQGQLGSKLRYSLDPFYLDKEFTNDTMKEIIRDAKLPEEIKYNLMSQNIALLNRYTRKYYLSRDKKYRITIDSNMKYVQLSLLHNTYINKLSDYLHIILELKYDMNDDEGARIITNQFRFRMTKSSKYVTGIDRLHHSLL